MASNSPGEMRALGSNVKNFNSETWAKSVKGIAACCLHVKFTQNPKMADSLLATGKNVLIEAAPNDKLWGIGLSMFDPMIMNKQLLWGKNIQGQSLMNIHSQIKETSIRSSSSKNY